MRETHPLAGELTRRAGLSAARRLIVGVAVLLVGGCSRVDSSGRRDAPRPAEVSSVTAEQVLATVRGANAKAVLVNAWATWCDSCREELPMLQRLGELYRQRGVRVLLVSVDEPEDRAKLAPFLKGEGITLPTYLAERPLGPFKAGLNPRWPGMLPASFLFDGAGNLRYFWGGEAYEKEVVPVLDDLLAGKDVNGEASFGLAPGQTTDRSPTPRAAPVSQ
jgi:thiol-disulfide isomerase/thioredoxin